MNETKITRLRERAALWTSKADALITQAGERANRQAVEWINKAKALQTKGIADAAYRAATWEARGNPERAQKAEQAGALAADARYAFWEQKALDHIQSETANADYQANIWRARADALLKEANEAL